MQIESHSFNKIIFDKTKTKRWVTNKTYKKMMVQFKELS